MSKFEEKVQLYKQSSDELGLGLSESLIRSVTKGLGPSIYQEDSSKVSGSDKDELTRVKTNFLVKKLGLKDGPELDAAVAKAVEKMGQSNRNKYRALVYALLVKKFKKESIYS